MIDRRRFVRTLTAATVGSLASTYGGNAAESSARRRAIAPRPGAFRSSGGKLEAGLQAAEREISLAGREARLFSYNGRVPGPLFESRPGDEITIRFENSLREATNLHFHGLHVPPTGVADNIFLHVEPGQTLTYQFALPADHPAGLYWVHPHLHGSVARQLARGLAAPFVVRGEIDEIPEVAAADEFILLLQDFELTSDGLIAEPSMPERFQGREGSIVTLGGAINPIIPIHEGGLLRLRLINASPSRFYRLRLEEHPLHVIGVDGGALPAVRTEDEVLLVPGERLDILVAGDRVPGSFRLLNLPYGRGSMGMMGPGGTTGPPQQLAVVEYRGRSEQRWSVPASLSGGVERLIPSVQAARRFQLGMGMGMRFTIDGREFDANRIDVSPRLGTVEEWVYVNATPMDHPMHLHTNPFQIVGPDPAWKDVVLVKAGSEARIRVRFADYAGKTVHHCHILDHEDLGMMATVEMRS